VQRQAAQAIDETELVPSEPVTVVLSEKGWARAAKGHVDAAALSYREGDGLLAAARARSTQQVAFLDSEAALFDAGAHPAVCARQRRTADRPLLAGCRSLVPDWPAPRTRRASCWPPRTATASSPASRT
jgi:DNA gyrase/topoisomerase IV subunit A